MSADRSRQAEERPGFRLALSAAGAITSQAVLVTAVLYYFGWAYARAWYGYFGFDVGMLGLSVPDYVLRSISAAFWPALLLLLGILVLANVSRLPVVLAVRGRRPRRMLRRWVVAVTILGCALLALVAAGVVAAQFVRVPLGRYEPIVLLLGVLLLADVVGLRLTYPALFDPEHRRRRRTPSTTPLLPLLTLVLLSFLGGLWAVGTYAEGKGHDDARAAEATGFIDRPSIVLFSTDRLAIEGHGTEVGEITAPGEKYRYAYSGLWLLAHTSDEYYLLPQKWRAGRDRVFVVNATDNIRIDIARNP